MRTTKDAELNNFAIRSFRDTADRDYIHARLAYRARLVPQFQWSALHCLEKYAKGVLLINRVSTHGIKHEVLASLNKMREAGTFEVAISDASRAFIGRLEEGSDRYFERSYVSGMHDIVKLDRAVSELRRYCQVLDWDIETENGPHNILKSSLARIQQAASASTNDTCIMSGWLERVIKDKKHPARPSLVWKNLYFSSIPRARVKLIGFTEAGNSPLDMHPELLDDVAKYVYLPRRLQTQWRQEAEERLRTNAQAAL